MAEIIKVAVFDASGQVAFSTLDAVCKGAFQKQISQDFAPHWGVDAIIQAFPSLESIPSDYWITYILSSNTPSLFPENEFLKSQTQVLLNNQLYGYHLYVTNQTIKYNGVTKYRPFAVLQYTSSWTLTVSHEVMEMIADPWGDRVMSGEIFNPETDTTQQVEHLVEVADPSQNPNFGYFIDGVQVSDFVLPAYFDLVKVTGKRYSFTGAITEPGQILLGGYRSFRNRLGEWWQAFNIDNEIIYKKLSTGETLTANQSGKIIRIVSFALGFVLIIAGSIYFYLSTLKKDKNGTSN